MPCYQVRYTEVDLKSADINLLFEGMKKDKLFSNLRRNDNLIAGDYKGLSFMVAGGKLTTQYRASQTIDIGNAVNRAYTRNVVQTTAKKHGWIVENVSDDGLSFDIVQQGY